MMKAFVCIAFVVISIVTQATMAAPYTLGVMLPWTLGNTEAGYGTRIHPAVKLAFQAINEDRSFLEEVRQTTWVWHDDGCELSTSPFATMQLIHEYSIDTLIGPSCASLVETTVEMCAYFDMPVIAYSISSFARATPTEYPNLVRTAAPHSALDEITLGWFQEFGWKKAFVLFETGMSGWETTAGLLSQTLENADIDVTQRFVLTPEGSGEEAASASRLEALTEIQGSGWRIVLVYGSCSTLVKVSWDMATRQMLNGYGVFFTTILDSGSCVLDSADREHLADPRLNSSFYISHEFPDGASFQTFRSEAYESFNYFFEYIPPPNGTAVRTSTYNKGSNPFGRTYTPQNVSSLAFLDFYLDEWGYAANLYDAILLYARALNFTLTQGKEFTYRTLLEAIPHVTPFTGAWTSVEFGATSTYASICTSFEKLCATGAPFERQLEARVYNYRRSKNGTISLTAVASKSASSNFTMLADKSSLAWAGSGNTAPVDFVDPNNTCSAEDLRYEVIKIYAFAVRFVVRYRFIDGTTCDTDCFHLPEENTLITDQFPLHTATGIGNALCAVVGVVLFGSLATFVYIYRQQNPLQKVDVSVVLVTFFLSMLVSVSPIVFIGQPSDALCRLRNWVLFLPGFMMYSFMLARMYYMTTIMQEIKVSKRKATRQMFRMFLIWNTPLVLLLLVSTAYRPAKAIPKVIQATDAPTVVIDHFECTNVDSGLFYSTIAYLGMMALIGLWITSKALGGLTLASALWGTSKEKTWEVRVTAYKIYIIVLVLFLEVVGSLYQELLGLDLYRMIVCKALSILTMLSIIIIWFPKVSLVLSDRFMSARVTNGEKRRRQSNSSRDNEGKEDEQRQSLSFHSIFDEMPRRASHITTSSKYQQHAATTGQESPAG